MDNGSYLLTSLSMTDLTIREHHLCNFFIHNSTMDNWIILSDKVFTVQVYLLFLLLYYNFCMYVQCYLSYDVV